MLEASFYFVIVIQRIRDCAKRSRAIGERALPMLSHPMAQGLKLPRVTRTTEPI